MGREGRKGGKGHLGEVPGLMTSEHDFTAFLDGSPGWTVHPALCGWTKAANRLKTSRRILFSV